MDTLSVETRHAFRTLTRSPGFSAAVILLLALGIGATTVIWSVVDGVLLRPLPYPEPGELMTVWERNVPRDRPTNVVSPANFVSWREGIDRRESNGVFQEMAAVTPWRGNYAGGGEPREVSGQLVTPGFFTLLGVEPLLGRTLDAGEAGGKVVVLSHRFWQRHLGGDPEVVGTTLTLDGDVVEVVGVMPPGFTFQDGFWFRDGHPELWLPTPVTAEFRTFTGRYLAVVARLAPGVDRQRAQAEMTAIGRRLEQERPEANSGWEVNVVPLTEMLVGDLRPALGLLAGAVALVLLIACANAASLLLARAVRRAGETSVRAALGATRWRLARHLLTQTAALALAGGALGLALAAWGIDAVTALEWGDVPRIDGVGLDLRAVAFALGVAAGTALLLGLIPALQAARPGLTAALGRAGRGDVGGRGRLRRALVAGEVAVAVLLLVGAGLLLRSFERLSRVDPGLAPAQLLTFRVPLTDTAYPEDHQRLAFFQRLTTELAALPAVESASAVSSLPLAGPPAASSFWAAERPRPEAGQAPVTDVRAAAPGYFRTMGTPLLEGRDLGAGDAPESPEVAVVSRSLARRLWPDGDAVGKRVVLSWGEPVEMEVVGVVGDIRLAGLDAPARPTLYRPMAQMPGASMYLVVRTRTSPLALASRARETVRALDAAQPVTELATMDSVLASSVARPRINTQILALFAAAATLLAALGIYSVLAYSVSERRREIGVRMALGAGRGEVQALVVRQGMATVLLGLALGLAAALAASRLLESLLFEVSATDPLTYFAVAALLGAVALIAAVLPARRASRVDPAVAIQGE